MILNEVLEPIAAWFRTLGIPQPIVHWGHPLMMAIVVFVMGSFVAFTGWRGRISHDGDIVIKNRSSHRQLAPWMFLFIALGYTGGILSLVMQHQPILQSSHFWTGSVVLLLLLLSSSISLIGFGPDKTVLRTIHAYLGSTALCILCFHAILGWQLGMQISQ